MKKINAIIIITIFLISTFTSLICLHASSNANKLDQTDSLKNINSSDKNLDRGEPPEPPVVWTNNFSIFYISVPQDPENDQVFYYVDFGDGTNTDWLGPYEPGETVYLLHIWPYDGAYQMIARAKDHDGKSKDAVYTLTLTSDLKIFNIETGYVNLSYMFTIYLKQITYSIFIEWGDGTNSDWFGPYYQTISISHKWSLPGEYTFKFKLRDTQGNESNWLSSIVKITPIKDNPPTAPIIRGKIFQIPGTFEYSFISTDPDGDVLKYFIDWGDETYSGWIGPYYSGEEIRLTHTFPVGWMIYIIKAKAMDTENYESQWGYLPVVVSKNTRQSMNPFFFKLIKQHVLVI